MNTNAGGLNEIKMMMMVMMIVAMVRVIMTMMMMMNDRDLLLPVLQGLMQSHSPTIIYTTLALKVSTSQ